MNLEPGVQVITVKSKYMAENQTGMPIEIKQRGCPDLGPNEGYTSGDPTARCAYRLGIGEMYAPLYLVFAAFLAHYRC